MIPSAIDPDFHQHWEEIIRQYKIPSDLSSEKQTDIVHQLMLYVYQNLPERLFRYRCFDENDYSINAFRDDLIYSVKANKFNDPFDTLLKYDDATIIKNVADPEVTKKLRDYVSRNDVFPPEIQNRLDPMQSVVLRAMIMSLRPEQIESITQNYDSDYIVKHVNQAIEEEI